MDPTHTKKQRLHELFPAIAPKIPRCRLLELPRELRGEIYEFALTYGESLRVTTNMKLFPVRQELNAKGQDGAAPVEANTIEFTCRQIYTETRGLTMRLNDTFIFKSSAADEHGLSKFLEFAWKLQNTRCTPKRIDIYPDFTSATHRHSLNFVRLHDDLTEVFAAPQQPFLRNFCEKHSDTVVLLHLKILRQPYYLLPVIFGILESFMNISRSQETLPLVPSNLRVVLEMEDEDQGGSGDAQWCLSSVCTSGYTCNARATALFEEHRVGL
jgi:hypothetical protein